MLISVASGKGGTGKTTVSTNLAASIDQPTKLLDCDVEEPNDHLFVKAIESCSTTVYTYVPSIDKERCSGCGSCATICQFNALAVIGGNVLIFPELCHSCGACQEICSEQAVGDGSRELGQLVISRRGPLTLVHGCLRVGEAMSPPLIRRVRATAREEDLAIIDAPPGTSCPAITSIKDTDFVLLVTEPTPFGLHDLELAVEAVKQLGIPCGLVINRADIGNDAVRRYAETEAIPMLMEIPFDRRIAEIYSRGQLLIEVMPEWRPRFNKLLDDITTMIRERESA